MNLLPKNLIELVRGYFILSAPVPLLVVVRMNIPVLGSMYDNHNDRLEGTTI